MWLHFLKSTYVHFEVTQIHILGGFLLLLQVIYNRSEAIRKEKGRNMLVL